MRNFKIITTLNIVPTKKLTKYWYKVTRGTSTNFMFDLVDRAYNFEDIVQLSYRFVSKTGQMIHYDMYIYNYLKDGTIEAIFNDEYFEHVKGYSTDLEQEIPYEYVNLKLTGNDTNEFWLANKDNPLNFEVAVTINNNVNKDTENNYTYIEKQLPVIVLDSRGVN